MKQINDITTYSQAITFVTEAQQQLDGNKNLKTLLNHVIRLLDSHQTKEIVLQTIELEEIRDDLLSKKQQYLSEIQTIKDSSPELDNKMVMCSNIDKCLEILEPHYIEKRIDSIYNDGFNIRELYEKIIELCSRYITIEKNGIGFLEEINDRSVSTSFSTSDKNNEKSNEMNQFLQTIQSVRFEHEIKSNLLYLKNARLTQKNLYSELDDLNKKYNEIDMKHKELLKIVSDNDNKLSITKGLIKICNSVVNESDVNMTVVNDYREVVKVLKSNKKFLSKQVKEAEEIMKQLLDGYYATDRIEALPEYMLEQYKHLNIFLSHKYRDSYAIDINSNESLISTTLDAMEEYDSAANKEQEDFLKRLAESITCQTDIYNTYDTYIEIMDNNKDATKKSIREFKSTKTILTQKDRELQKSLLVIDKEAAIIKQKIEEKEKGISDTNSKIDDNGKNLLNLVYGTKKDVSIDKLIDDIMGSKAFLGNSEKSILKEKDTTEGNSVLPLLYMIMELTVKANSNQLVIEKIPNAMAFQILSTSCNEIRDILLIDHEKKQQMLDHGEEKNNKIH